MLSHPDSESEEDTFSDYLRGYRKRLLDMQQQSLNDLRPVIIQPGNGEDRIINPNPDGSPVSLGREPSTLQPNNDPNGPVADPTKFRCPVMSKLHVELSWSGPETYIRDLGSTHGTWLRKRTSTCTSLVPISSRRPLKLEHGMIIQFGRAVTYPKDGTKYKPLEVTIKFPSSSSPSRSKGTYGLTEQILQSSEEENYAPSACDTQKTVLERRFVLPKSGLCGSTDLDALRRPRNRSTDAVVSKAPRRLKSDYFKSNSSSQKIGEKSVEDSTNLNDKDSHGASIRSPVKDKYRAPVTSIETRSGVSSNTMTNLASSKANVVNSTDQQTNLNYDKYGNIVSKKSYNTESSQRTLEIMRDSKSEPECILVGETDSQSEDNILSDCGSPSIDKIEDKLFGTVENDKSSDSHESEEEGMMNYKGKDKIEEELDNENEEEESIEEDWEEEDEEEEDEDEGDEGEEDTDYESEEFNEEKEMKDAYELNKSNKQLAGFVNQESCHKAFPAGISQQNVKSSPFNVKIRRAEATINSNAERASGKKPHVSEPCSKAVPSVTAEVNKFTRKANSMSKSFKSDANQQEVTKTSAHTLEAQRDQIASKKSSCGSTVTVAKSSSATRKRPRPSDLDENSCPASIKRRVKDFNNRRHNPKNHRLKRVACKRCAVRSKAEEPPETKRRRFSSVISAAQSLAIFALGGVATVAGILVFENVADL
ncbi:hypothetical protein BY996DRAFT_6908615 [Phakopsora pachyrhizi]|uniref:FHA domain-containing protein n=1 Tax=Phakopsora pachyrhizi TaxID=170000 RepID=A0AAV0AX64_PHAPC|nr:hypothetical protein BY996DRAFT_6908615 [Phakopsora pachyrhizi]CAH7674554.1 hypothetical protein PPACK8108_LOCUS9450 [Phakopsora pachyrhizi]